MRRRLSTRDLRRPGPSSRPTRLALALVGVFVLLMVAIAIRNLRRHDALVQWRMGLENAAGRPAWPAWSPTWPTLPPAGRRRHGVPGDLRGPYAYAARHPQVLRSIPCYCGCVDEGHSSVLNCFVKSFGSDGLPVWTDHSLDCEMCVHIAREVLLMSSQGVPISQIRAAIDRRYGHGSHRPTNTPILTPLSHELDSPLLGPPGWIAPPAAMKGITQQ